MLITLFGKPGSGKTTIGDFFESRHGFTHLALSRLLRNRKFLSTIGISEVDMATAFSTGQTISVASLFDWLDSEISRATKSVVVDGYPREPAALIRFNALARRLVGRTHVVALKLMCSRDVAFNRALARARADDTPALLEARFHDYAAVQCPLFNELDPSIRRITTKATDLSAIAAIVLDGADAH